MRVNCLRLIMWPRLDFLLRRRLDKGPYALGSKHWPRRLITEVLKVNLMSSMVRYIMLWCFVLEEQTFIYIWAKAKRGCDYWNKRLLLLVADNLNESRRKYSCQLYCTITCSLNTELCSLLSPLPICLSKERQKNRPGTHRETNPAYLRGQRVLFNALDQWRS